MDDKFNSLKTVDDLSILNGVAFEEYLYQLFTDLGYRVEKTPTSGDFGADLIMELVEERIVVQAKQYSGKAGFDSVKEALFARNYYNADGAWVIATHGFTKQAYEAAANAHIRLIDGYELERIIASKNNGSGSNSCIKDRPQRKPRGPRFTFDGNEERTLVQYHWSESEIVIPPNERIVSIGPQAFCSVAREKLATATPPICKSEFIEVVRIPEGVKSIAAKAFMGCVNLKTIELPHTLESIGDSAFYGCKSLQSIVLPERLRLIGESALANTGLCEIAIPEGCVVSRRALSNCGKLTDARFGDGVFEIGQECFNGCIALERAQLPRSLTNIPTGLFRGCLRLLDVQLPNSITEIGREAFMGCCNLPEIVLPPCLISIGESAFSQCRSLEEVNIPECVKEIQQFAFRGCDRLFEVELPNGLSRVFRSAFVDCDLLDTEELFFYAPESTNIINDAYFDGMFDGEASEIRFEPGPNFRLTERSEVIDPGVQGLNVVGWDMRLSGDCRIYSTGDYPHGYFCHRHHIFQSEGYVAYMDRDKPTIIEVSPGDYIFLCGCTTNYSGTPKGRDELRDAQIRINMQDREAEQLKNAYRDKFGNLYTQQKEMQLLLDALKKKLVPHRKKLKELSMALNLLSDEIESANTRYYEAVSTFCAKWGIESGSKAWRELVDLPRTIRNSLYGPGRP